MVGASEGAAARAASFSEAMAEDEESGDKWDRSTVGLLLAGPFIFSLQVLDMEHQSKARRTSKENANPYSPSHGFLRTHEKWSQDDDHKANLARFKVAFPYSISKDKHGWLLNPITLALNSGVKGSYLSLCL
ncbi:hypothetical protein SLEP1_g53084 [Rubroshorea leprosula]|uniref:Uncharacterized protein n=1 Tax=Rubroshorea leprosula TaxID=152421 RepID=A0AAV5MBS4_9ROSI|nr:hypothetical protein SLEP1_g53084 [Rubroshorea leprosula]